VILSSLLGARSVVDAHAVELKFDSMSSTLSRKTYGDKRTDPRLSCLILLSKQVQNVTQPPTLRGREISTSQSAAGEKKTRSD